MDIASKAARSRHGIRVLAALGAGLACIAAVAGPGVPGQVDDARVAADTSGDNWLVKGGGYDQAQFSPLRDVNANNVANLGLAWSLDFDSPLGLTAEPLVVDGVIYLSAPHSLVYAIDAVSGRVRWKFDPHVDLGGSIEGSSDARTSRGVAVWAGRVYVGTSDCRLVAIEAATGHPEWDSRVCDGHLSGVSGAPRVARGKVYVGYSGADSHMRGSIAAFDARDGHEVWRFWTVPGDPSKGFESKTVERAAQTWSGSQWWRQGGGTVWDPITFDAKTGLLLFGTSKAFLRDTATGQEQLPGAKLYSGSIVAVNADTGEYAWHYQTSTPQRQSENFHIVIADLRIGGHARHVAMTAARNGNYYVFDAASGELLSSTPLVPQGLPKALGGSGPGQIDYPGVVIGGVEDCESACFGVRNWWPMSYDAVSHLTYVPITDLRRAPTPQGALPMVGRLVAWDPVQRRARWSVEHEVMVNSGVLSTAGGLVFQGQGTGEFAAYAADSGRKLWSVDTGSAIDSVPVAYRVGGEEYVLVPVGWSSIFRYFASSNMTSTATSRYGATRLLAFKLGGRAELPRQKLAPPPVPLPPEQKYDAQAVARGEEFFGTFGCSGCHSPRAEGSGRWVLDGGIPDLRYAPADVHKDWYAIVLGGTHRSRGMPSFAAPTTVPPVPAMTAAQADDIHAYVIDRAWAAYRAQPGGH